MLSLLAMAFALPSVDEPLRTNASAPNDTAVVVGLEDYIFLSDVPYAANDAAAVADFLISTRGVPLDRVQRFTSASREQILAAVQLAGERAGPEGTVWLYLAGHGVASPSDGRRLFLGDDARQDPAAFEARGVPIDELEALATQSGAAVTSLVDACFNGQTRGGDAVVEGTRFAVPTYAIDLAPRTLTWAASGPDQLARPLDEAKHGAFTYLALGAMRGWADGEISGERDGAVTAEEAQLYVMRGLRKLNIRDQQPVLRTQAPASVLAEGDLETPPELVLSAIPADGTLIRVEVPNGYHPNLVAAAAGYGVALPLVRKPFGYRDANNVRVRGDRIMQLARSTPKGKKAYLTRGVGLGTVVVGWVGAMALGTVALASEDSGYLWPAAGSMAVGLTGAGLLVAGQAGLDNAVQPDFR